MNQPSGLSPEIQNEQDFNLINRNVICLDKDGKEIWRIEAPELERRADSFIHVFKNKKDGQWIAISHMGHECNLDIETGKLSNIRYDAVK